MMVLPAVYHARHASVGGSLHRARFRPKGFFRLPWAAARRAIRGSENLAQRLSYPALTVTPLAEPRATAT